MTRHQSDELLPRSMSPSWPEVETWLSERKAELRVRLVGERGSIKIWMAEIRGPSMISSMIYCSPGSALDVAVASAMKAYDEAP